MIRRLPGVLLCAVLLQSCGEDSAGTGTPVLYLDSETIEMNVSAGTIGTRSFRFRNAGKGILEVDDLTLTLLSGGTEYPWSWVHVDPTSLRIDEGDQASVTLTADATSQPTGTYRGNMTISTNDPNNVRVNIPMTVHVTENAQSDISLNPTSFEIYLHGGETDQLIVTVTNMGSAAGDVISVSAGCDWVSAEPTSLHLEPSQSDSILLIVTATGLESGEEHRCVVTFATTDPQTPNKTITVALTVVQARVVVAEEFTATWCAYCPGAMLGLHQLEQEVGREGLAVVAYHLADEFCVAGNDERALLYNVSPIPDVWFDGSINQIGGDETTPMDYTAFYEQRAATSAPMTLALSVTDYSPALGTGHVEAGMLNVGDLPLDCTLLLVITCADTAYSWQGQDHLYSTAIGYIGGVEGFEISVEPGGPEETIQLDFAVPSAWIGRDLQIVGIAQDAWTTDIHQGAVADLQ